MFFKKVFSRGEVLEQVDMGMQEGGVEHLHEFDPDSSGLSGGTYLYRIISGRYVATGKLLSSTTMAGGAVRAAALSPDGGLVLAAVGRRTQLVDFATGRVIRRFPPGKKPIFTVAFAPDGQTVAWAGADATIEVWSTRPR